MSTTPQKGRADYLELGTWNVACAECGRKRKAHEMRQLPPGVPGGGMYVCFPEHWNMRQPQDYVRGVPDKMAAPYVQQQVETYPLYVENVNEDTTDLEIEVDTGAAPADSNPLIINIQGVILGTLTVTDVEGGLAVGSIVLNNNGGAVEEIINNDDVPLTTQGTGVTAGVASRLGFTVQPSETAEDTAISPAIVVAVQDGFGNTVVDSTATITLSFTSNPGGATLGGTLSQVAVAGLTTFSDVTVSEPETGYQLAAVSSGLATAYSSLFEITEAGYILNAAELGAPPDISYGKDTVSGSIAPSTYAGFSIRNLKSAYTQGSEPPYFVTFSLSGAHSQNLFTTLIVNGVSFNSADAVFSSSNTWEWESLTNPIPTNTTYNVSIV